MKITKILSVLTIVALASSGFANTSSHEESTSVERTNMLINLGIMTLLSAGIHKGGNAMQLSGASKGILHTANVLYQLGQISEKPVLRDLSTRALLIGLSSKLASTKTISQDLTPYIPFIGQSIKEAGAMGVGIMTVSMYNVFGAAYDAAKNFVYDHTHLEEYLPRN